MEVSMSVMPPARRQFSYRPFGHDEASTHIRVIRVLPIKQGCGEEIRCVMTHTRRPSSGPGYTYSCLSYTWQPENPGRKIYIIGIDNKWKKTHAGVKEVGKNLGDFLSAARDANIADWLWIDALCINQEDTAEKEQQVRQMGQTYKQAYNVFVWLGSMDEPTIHALESFVEDVEEAPDVTDEVLPTHPQAAWLGLLSNILSASYWTRVWIAQEFLLANQPILFFQNFQIDGFKFAWKLSRFITSFRNHKRIVRFMTLQGWRYFSWRLMSHDVVYDILHDTLSDKSTLSERRCIELVSLASLIPKFAKSACQDKRDRVYALLSLADDGDPGLVDYKISEGEVFRNTMALMKRHKRPMDELLLIGGALIEALELWPATSPSSSILEINLDGPEDITPPIWGCATLEMEAADETARETIKTTCMYVGIHDGPNIHVFEYAVETLAEDPIVKYSRAHEYLRGHPPASFVPASDDEVKYFWLENMPSEALHYFAGRRATRQLWSWTAQDFEISGLRIDESTEHGDRDILPALRIVNSMRSTAGLLWDVVPVPQVAQHFLATFDSDLRRESQEYQYDASVPPLAHHPRSTTLRFDVKKDMEAQREEE